jgi:uncharacterized protein YukE
VSTIGDALKGIRELLLIQADVRALEKAVDAQADAIKQIARDLIEVDKRVSHIEGMVRGAEMVARQRRLEE